MTTAQRSFLFAAFALQAGCFSAGPSAPQPYPVPDASVFAALTCDELIYKRDGYQVALQNVAVDHPADSQLYAPGYQANLQGLNNAIALRGCPAGGQTATGAAAAPTSPYANLVPSYVADTSVYLPMSCDDLAYKKNGYEKQLSSVVTDHPVDTYKHAEALKVQSIAIGTAMTQKGCAVAPISASAPALAPLAAKSASGRTYCFAYSQRRSMLEPQSTNVGVVSKPWQAGPLASAPARTALVEFQAYLLSRGGNESLGPMSCTPQVQNQLCTASKSDQGEFSHGMQIANVMCDESRESLEKGLTYVNTSSPLLQVVDWRPTQQSAAVAPLTATPQVVAPQVAAPSAAPLGAPAAASAAPAPTTAGKSQLGVYTSPVTPAVVKSFGLPSATGVLVLGPVPGSFAEKAGMLAGDIILEIAGTPVNTPADLAAISSRMRPGYKAPLRVWRYRATIDVTVQISAATQ